MKNAYVIDDHHGDNGTVRAGDVLFDVTENRFEQLEKRGLVREATDAEVRKAKKTDEPENKQAEEPDNKAAPKSGNKGR